MILIKNSKSEDDFDYITFGCGMEVERSDERYIQVSIFFFWVATKNKGSCLV